MHAFYFEYYFQFLVCLGSKSKESLFLFSIPVPECPGPGENKVQQVCNIFEESRVCFLIFASQLPKALSIRVSAAMTLIYKIIHL